MLTLDHIFCMVDPDGPWAAHAESAGWTLDEGIQHEGQGTRNRRLRLREQYLEFLWVCARDEAEQNPLRLDRRADWRTTGASPFGIALRGTLPEVLRPQFWAYRPPYAPDFAVWIHRSNELAAAQPFLFVMEIQRAVLDVRHTLREVIIESPETIQGLLGDMTPAIRWRRGEQPHMHIVTDGPPVELHELLSLSA